MNEELPTKSTKVTKVQKNKSVFVHIYVHKCTHYMYIYTYVHVNQPSCIYVCIYASVYLCVYVCMYIKQQIDPLSQFKLVCRYKQAITFFQIGDSKTD